jgi:hypothetical protein
MLELMIVEEPTHIPSSGPSISFTPSMIVTTFSTVAPSSMFGIVDAEEELSTESNVAENLPESPSNSFVSSTGSPTASPTGNTNTSTATTTTTTEQTRVGIWKLTFCAK